jgi:hypothetical protein
MDWHVLRVRERRGAARTSRGHGLRCLAGRPAFNRRVTARAGGSSVSSGAGTGYVGPAAGEIGEPRAWQPCGGRGRAERNVPTCHRSCLRMPGRLARGIDGISSGLYCTARMVEDIRTLSNLNFCEYCILNSTRTIILQQSCS